MTDTDVHADHPRADQAPSLFVPVSPALADATFRVDPLALSEASGHVRLSAIKTAIDAALAEFNRTCAHTDEKRRATLDIVRDLALGDKAIARGLHERWSEEERRRFGDPPSPRTVRRWVAADRSGGHVPERDYVRREKSRGRRAKAPDRAANAAAPSDESAGLDGRLSLSVGPAHKAAAERMLRRARTDAVFERTPGYRSTNRQVAPRVGDLVRIECVRRFLGRTAGGGFAFAAVDETGERGGRLGTETLQGVFTCASRFRRS